MWELSSESTSIRKSKRVGIEPTHFVYGWNICQTQINYLKNVFFRFVGRVRVIQFFIFQAKRLCKDRGIMFILLFVMWYNDTTHSICWWVFINTSGSFSSRDFLSLRTSGAVLSIPQAKAFGGQASACLVLQISVNTKRTLNMSNYELCEHNNNNNNTIRKPLWNIALCPLSNQIFLCAYSLEIWTAFTHKRTFFFLHDYPLFRNALLHVISLSTQIKM